jgi:hypothetical protein
MLRGSPGGLLVVALAGGACSVPPLASDANPDAATDANGSSDAALEATGLSDAAADSILDAATASDAGADSTLEASPSDAAADSKPSGDGGCSDGGCAPLCGESIFEEGEILADGGTMLGKVPGLGDYPWEWPLGMSHDGALLHCHQDQGTYLIVLSTPSADAGAGYDTVPLNVPDAAPITAACGAHLNVDGTTVTLVVDDELQIATLNGNVVGMPVLTPFTNVDNALAGGSIFPRAPVITDDGLTVYFETQDSSNVQHIWVATRQTTGEEFVPQPQPLAELDGYIAVTGVSADHLTLFLDGVFEAEMLTRTDTTQSWDAATPSRVLVNGAGSYWEANPTASCDAIFTTCSTTGAINERICKLRRAQ